MRRYVAEECLAILVNGKIENCIDHPIIVWGERQNIPQSKMITQKPMERGTENKFQISKCKFLGLV